MRLYIIFIVVMALMSGIFFWYYKDTQNTITILNQNNAKLEIATATSEKTIKSLQNDYSATVAENKRINREYASIRRQNNLLREKLANSDFKYLALSKPELIEQLINEGTKNANRCFEILSGAPLTDKERNATTDSEFNKECPWLRFSTTVGGMPR